MAYQIQFPDPNIADDDGLVAAGGNLSSEFLLAAYRQGLFPWFNKGEPILWWSPNPRMVLFPNDFKISRSLEQTLRSGKFSVKIDEKFEDVIVQCSLVERKGQHGTWITHDMMEAYIRLHHEGYAHSFETYIDDVLAGGLYGVSLGKVFFGESMFYIKRDASKIALYYLVKVMKDWDFHFIDVQQSTPHLKSMGAKDLDRTVFLKQLKDSLQTLTIQGKWNYDFQ